MRKGLAHIRGNRNAYALKVANPFSFFLRQVAKTIVFLLAAPPKAIIDAIN